jgi:hypothetical protein
MQITLVPCPNGMGHFNRLVKLASYFNTTNINLVCTKEQERKFKNKLNITIKLRSVLHEINLNSQGNSKKHVISIESLIRTHWPYISRFV